MRFTGAVGGRGQVEFSPAVVSGRARSGAVRPGAGAGVSTERTRAAGAAAGPAWLRALAAAGPWLRWPAGRCRTSGSSHAGAYGPVRSGSSPSVPGSRAACAPPRRSSPLARPVFGPPALRPDDAHGLMAVAPGRMELNGGAIRSVATGADVGSGTTARSSSDAVSGSGRCDPVAPGSRGIAAIQARRRGNPHTQRRDRRTPRRWRRRDGGDAETGFGVDIGGGLAWSDTRRGITAEFRGPGLLTHEADGFRERGVSGSLFWDRSRRRSGARELRSPRHRADRRAAG